MRGRIIFLFALLAVSLAGGAALANHFDGDASNGTFNPQLAVTVTQTVVSRVTGFTLNISQADHEDPAVVSRLRVPGDWQFAFNTRQAEDSLGVPTTDCKKSIDGLHDSPNGTGSGTNTDYSKRTDAHFARAERIGTVHLEVHADGVTRPGLPATWDGQVAFISYDATSHTAQLCALFISTDSRVTSLPDTNPDPSDDSDDIEGVTEIVGQFPSALVTDGGSQYWETLVDLTDLATDSTFQTLNVSLIKLNSTFNGHSAGNWVSGGVDFSRAPHVSGSHAFQGIFKTCPADDPSYGNCKSGRPDVTRTSTFSFSLVTPAVTGPANGTLTNVNPVSITGTADADEPIQIFEGSTPVGSPVQSDATTGAWTANVPLPDGAHTVTAKIVDAGGSSAASNARSFTLDTTPPNVPGISSPAQSATVGGVNVTFSGLAEAASRVEVIDSVTGSLGTATASATGAWSLVATLTKGPHAVQASATDAATNTSALTALRSFDVTTAIPSIVTPVQDAATNVGNVTFNGVSEQGSTVTLNEGGSPLGVPAIAGTGGAWSISVPLSEGEHTVSATAVKDGFVSPPSPLRTVTVDFTAPGAPAFTAPDDGAIVRSITVTIRGTSEAFASNAVMEGARRVGTGVADSNGDWSTTNVMSLGDHTVTAISTDRAGNVGPASGSISFFVDDPLAIITPEEGSLNAGTVVVSGNADAASTEVRLHEGFFEIGRAPVVDGTWTTTLSFESGTHSIQAQSVTGGIAGPLGKARTFHVDATPPVIKMFKPSGWLVFGRLIGEPLRGIATDQAPSDSLLDRIEVTYENFLTGETTVRAIPCGACPASSADWSDMPPLLPGFYSVTATAYDKVGNAGSENLLFMIV